MITRHTTVTEEILWVPQELGQGSHLSLGEAKFIVTQALTFL